MSNSSPHQDSQLLSLGRRLFGIFIAILIGIYALTNASSGQGGTVLSPGQGSSPNTGTTSSQPSGKPVTFGKQTKTSNCVAVNGVQDKACTPGAIFPDATTAQVCTPGYSASVRNVPIAEKDDVYA